MGDARTSAGRAADSEGAMLARSAAVSQKSPPTRAKSKAKEPGQIVLQRVGLYPGTFDPITLGHLDIILRAAKLVDRLVIGVAVNKDKSPLFSLADRVQMVEDECARLKLPCEVSVEPFDTLLMRFAQQVKANVIVRGLRAVSDFEYEFQMVAMNQKLDPVIETVFLMADPTHQAIASRLVKEIARLGGDVTQFVPAAVARRLATAFKEGA